MTHADLRRDPRSSAACGVFRAAVMEGPFFCSARSADGTHAEPQLVSARAHRSSLLFYLRCYDSCNKEQSAHLHGEVRAEPAVFLGARGGWALHKNGLIFYGY